MEKSPALSEAKPLAKDLSDIGTVGLEAMSYLSAGIAPTQQWRDARLATLDQAAKPKAALEFATISSVKQLVIGAAELAQLKTMRPEEWKKRVITLAGTSTK